MIKRCCIRLHAICLVIGPLFLSEAAVADPVMMEFEDYMTHCMNTYGDDGVTESVCEAQYTAIAEKEQALTAQAETLLEEDEQQKVRTVND
ncbi:hypothetical protein [Photobacterium nomapromontoriensis]|uniref:hypothetical protein n=1 Tax=Photobacterium nomapromontoriensis TaxID=2910237 RepID=UPI003D0C3211